jgi:predicted secreted hydrolase
MFSSMGQAQHARRGILLTFIIALCSLAAGPGDFQQAVTPRQWDFPRDHGRHDGFKLEWWYFTGNIHDSAGHRFGYQLTFFRSAMAPEKPDRASPWAMNDLYFAHAAVSDIDSKKFLYKDRLERSRPGLAWSSDQTMDVSLLDWSAKMTDGKIYLKCNEKDFSIDLVCSQGRGPVLEGPGGVNVKGHEQGQASYYYSITRLKTAGTLTMNAQVVHVEGLSWMDHEFSSDALATNQVGWDWMGLQLDDGADLMIYRMRDRNGSTDYLSGTEISNEGQPHYLSDAQIHIKGDLPWKSAASGADYPQRWNIAIAGRSPLVVTSDMPGQELLTNASTKVDYFEGAATVRNESGKHLGQGYLEMTGYAK